MAASVMYAVYSDTAKLNVTKVIKNWYFSGRIPGLHPANETSLQSNSLLLVGHKPRISPVFYLKVTENQELGSQVILVWHTVKSVI